MPDFHSFSVGMKITTQSKQHNLNFSTLDFVSKRRSIPLYILNPDNSVSFLLCRIEFLQGTSAKSPVINLAKRKRGKSFNVNLPGSVKCSFEKKISPHFPTLNLVQAGIKNCGNEGAKSFVYTCISQLSSLSIRRNGYRD